ncbi:MAG: hypothetical protein V2I33_15905 [Kangiellaceae bacterium]|jgi:hypothetical protein|nr:hypothetical protein [Kangiellaceae bacterium]
MLEMTISITVAAVVIALYQGIKGGFDYINQLRIEAKANVIAAPLWLRALMLLSIVALVFCTSLIWQAHNWFAAMALITATVLISVSIKMLFMPRNDSGFYQKLFNELG